jgi:spore coat polysaccharide biosynthesis protein SpsF
MAMLAGKPAFEHIVERLRRSRYLDGVMLATTFRPEDEALRACARRLGVPFYAGSSEDVLGRMLAAARSVSAEVIVQITGDCPLIDPQISDRVIEAYLKEKPDYAVTLIQAPDELPEGDTLSGGPASARRPSYPTGTETEVFATSLLADVDAITQDPADREHVSLYIYEHPEKYRLLYVTAPSEHARPEFRLCIDTQEDYQVVSAIYDALYPIHPAFGLSDIISFLDANPGLAAINAEVKEKPVRK